MDYKIIIVSKARWDKVETLSLFNSLENVFIFVDDDVERAKYVEHNPNINPDNIIATNKKGISANRNASYDYFNKGEKVVTLCDDVQAVQRLRGGKLVNLTPDELNEFIVKGFEVCEKNGTKLWGVYPVANHFYMKNSLSPHGFIIGTFSGIIISDIRHDLKLIHKEDYDFTIKHILKYKKVVRFNGYCVKAKHYTNKGGCCDFRTTETEQISINRLLELYPQYVKLNPNRENEILLNFKVKK